MGLGFTSKSKNSEGWGMGFLLVFFPEDQQDQNHHKTTTTTNFNLSPSSSSLIRRTNSANLFHKARSTISVCLLLLFTTLLIFTISTLPSSSATAAARHVYRRHLQASSAELSPPLHSTNMSSHALQGMGTLYRRGTRAMTDLVVAHAAESLSLSELKLFLRLFYRSSLASKSDLLLIFSSKTSAFDKTIFQETDSFSKLLTQYSDHKPSSNSLSFDVTQFTKLIEREKESGEPIWGRKTRSNSTEEGEAESTRPSYGSVVGFDVGELDPGNSLSGFLDHVPMSLRRWACYPMLLGRVRRNFKHVMLVDPKEILLLGDPLGRARSQNPESVILSVTNTHSGKHGKKNPDRTGSTRQKPVHPGIIVGGSRGVRRLSNAMLTDIVRASMQQHKKKNPVSESGIFNQLVGNDFVLKNVNLIVSGELVPDLSTLGGSGSKSGSHLNLRNHDVIRRGNLEVNSVVMKHLCSFPIDSTVYSDCLKW